jgi:hypothetical protein
VRRRYADDGDPGGRHIAAGHGQVECERSRAADDRFVRPRPVHALEWQQVREALHALLVRDHAEVLADRKDSARKLVEVLDGTDVEFAQKSSGQ